MKPAKLMDVQLNATEVELLEDLLRNRLKELWVEVRRTEDPDYHDELRRLEDGLRGVLQRLVEVEASCHPG
jgi:hypothetical protein